MCKVCLSGCGQHCPNLRSKDEVDTSVRVACKRVRGRYGRKNREAMDICRDAIDTHADNRETILAMGEKGFLLRAAHDKTATILVNLMTKLEQHVDRFPEEGEEPDEEEL